LQIVAQPGEIRNPFRHQFQFFQTVQKFIRRPARQNLHLPFVQRAPDAVFGLCIAFPMLFDGEIGTDFRMQGFQRGKRLHGASSHPIRRPPPRLCKAVKKSCRPRTRSVRPLLTHAQIGKPIAAAAVYGRGKARDSKNTRILCLCAIVGVFRT